MDLTRHGITPTQPVTADLSAAEWVRFAVNRGEAVSADNGAIVAMTGERTARSPDDKFVVRDPAIAGDIHWGKVNKPIDPVIFDRLWKEAAVYASRRPLFVYNGSACADPSHRLTLRVIAEQAWHAMFASCLFRGLSPAERAGFQPDWTILDVPNLKFDPVMHGTRTGCVIALSFDRRQVLIAGTHYAGEIKKSIFTVLNALLPLKGVLSMHCSANIGAFGDTALFFGLSGTGKTTLSADPDRRLIGDDEHGWSDDGVFNIEGGCYAKTIGLAAEKEPQIYSAIRFGSILENVPFRPGTNVPDYDSNAVTENTRAAYPLEYIPNAEPSGRGGHPKNIFFLSCDAFGVLPPIAMLTPEQAMQFFLCGYTAKVAGTELGVTEPKETFSTCFGAPFLPLAPGRYAELLRDRLTRFQVPVWMVNTGWTGGGYGVGKRINLKYTRAMLRSALTGELTGVPMRTDPHFGISVPTRCGDVPEGVLDPRSTWADSAAYDTKAAYLAGRFRSVYQSMIA